MIKRKEVKEMAIEIASNDISPKTISIDWGVNLIGPQENETFDQIQVLVLRYSRDIKPSEIINNKMIVKAEDLKIDPIKIMNNGICFSPRKKVYLALLNQGVQIIKSKIAESEGISVNKVRDLSTQYRKKVGVIQELVKIMAHNPRS